MGSTKVFLLVMTSVALSSLAQIAMKHGMTRTATSDALQGQAEPIGLILDALREPYVLAGLACYGLGALIWLLVLAHLDVSVAYPFVGLGLVVTMILGAVLLGEQVGVLRVAGTLFVVVGVFLLTKS